MTSTVSVSLARMVLLFFYFYLDPVLFVSFLNYCQRTAVLNRTLNPVWDQTLIMDITFYGDLGLLHKYCNDIVLEVYDKDVVVS